MSNSLNIKVLSANLLAIACALSLMAALYISERRCLAGAQTEQPLTVAASFTEKQFVQPDEAIELQLNRPLAESEGGLAILIRTTDVSSLFERQGLRFCYNAELVPLPLGESPLIVYLVSKEGEWKELKRFTLRVSKDLPVATVEAKEGKSPDVASTGATAAVATSTESLNASPAAEAKTAAATAKPEPSSAALEKKSDKRRMNFLPSLTLTIKSQPAQSTFPFSDQPERPTFIDGTLQATAKNEMTVGIFGLQSSFDFAGSTFRKEALRFGTLGDAAPRVDLASYLIQFNVGRVKFQAGHFSYGSQRQLINNFSSRGLMVTVPFLRRFDFSAAAMNGTQVVGYENFFGVAKRKHQLLSGTLGIELLPERPGGLRLEVGVLSGYVQPLSGFNRGNVNDTERSRGIALRLIMSDKAQRFRLEAGFTRNIFISPTDNLLNQGVDVVKIPPLRRSAHYLEMSLDVLKNFALTKTTQANLTLAFREEQVAPLFRSLGASTQADKIQYEIAANGSIGEISGQFSYVGFHDNLKNIPSILKSLTRSMHISLVLPASALFGGKLKNSPWLPRLGYSFDRLHQFGAALPVNGGFEIDPSSVPDFFGTNQSFSADWQIKKFTIGYNLNNSFQNNEQTGRELADQKVLVNSGRFGIALSSRLNINLDLSAESSANKETGRIDTNYRVGPGFSFQITKSLGLTANLSNAIAGDKADTVFRRNTDFDAALTYRFGFGERGFKKVAVEAFIRYSNHYGRSSDKIFFLNDLRKNQVLTANVGFTFF